MLTLFQFVVLLVGTCAVVSRYYYWLRGMDDSQWGLGDREMLKLEPDLLLTKYIPLSVEPFWTLNTGSAFIIFIFCGGGTYLAMLMTA